MLLLVVEDHHDTAKAFSLLLRRSGYRVHVAYTIRAALALCEKNNYNILLADIGLPDGSGCDLMRTLLACSQTKGIAISGYGYGLDIQKSLEAGFAEHLTKPILFEKLIASIERVAALPRRMAAGVRSSEGVLA